jgi:hypothetical protein
MVAQNEVLARAYLVDSRHHFGANLGKLGLKIEQWDVCHARQNTIARRAAHGRDLTLAEMI